jgi:hypothetical protein
MKTSEMKELVQSQRYFLISLTCMVPHLDDEQIKNIVKQNIEYLWSTTEILDESFNLKVMTFDDIIKHGNEMLALSNMFNQKYDKDKVN